jgi:hypothetical protein
LVFQANFQRAFEGTELDESRAGRVGINGVRNFRQALASPHPGQISRFGAATFEVVGF